MLSCTNIKMGSLYEICTIELPAIRYFVFVIVIFHFLIFLYQDAVYIELAGSHAHEGAESVPNELVSSLMSTRHPLDVKMKQAQVTLLKVRVAYSRVSNTRIVLST